MSTFTRDRGVFNLIRLNEDRIDEDFPMPKHPGKKKRKQKPKKKGKRKK